MMMMKMKTATTTKKNNNNDDDNKRTREADFAFYEKFKVSILNVTDMASLQYTDILL